MTAVFRGQITELGNVTGQEALSTDGENTERSLVTTRLEVVRTRPTQQHRKRIIQTGKRSGRVTKRPVVTA